jgi:hypothetical protein
MKEKQQISYIYEIKDWRGNFYIGKKFAPSSKTGNYYGSGVHLNHSMLKHGKEKFQKTILCEGYFTIKQLNILEKFYISLYRENWNAHYNHTDGGDGGVRDEISLKKSSESLKKTYREHPELREKIRQQMLILGQNPEFKLKVSQGNKGKKRTEEQKKTYSKSATERANRQEMKDKMSKILTGKKRTEEQKQYISKRTKEKMNNPEIRQKISEGKKQSCLNDEIRLRSGNGTRGKKWYNNGQISVMSFSCPDRKSVV